MLQNRLYPSCRDTILEEDFSLVTKIGLCWRGDNWLTESGEIAVLLADFGRNPISMEPGKSCSQKGVSSEKLSTTLSKSIAHRECWSWRLPSTVNRESHSLRSFVYCRRGEGPADAVVGCWAIKRWKNFLLLPEPTDSVVRPSKWTNYLYLIFMFTRHAQDNGCRSEKLEIFIWFFFVSPDIS